MNVKKVLGVVIAFVAALNLSGATPTETLTKASKALSAAQGISANFQLSTGGKVFKGVYKAKGNKFAMVSNGLSVWYDGKNMWTYNHLSKETTLTKPTMQEIAESNPLSYIRNYAANYNVSSGKKTVKGRKTVILTPKKTAKGYIPVEIEFDEISLKPLRIKMSSKGLGSTILFLSGVSYDAKLGDAEFKYPASRYKGVEIIDMR